MGRRRKGSHVYRLTIYMMGVAIDSLETVNRDEARRFYRRHTTGNSSVRLYVDGERLRLTESNKLFLCGMRDSNNTLFV